MLSICSLQSEQSMVAQEESRKDEFQYPSIWVIIGFMFWFGFYLGAVIMHAATK
jgi:hypothetical protein